MRYSATVRDFPWEADRDFQLGADEVFARRGATVGRPDEQANFRDDLQEHSARQQQDAQQKVHQAARLQRDAHWRVRAGESVELAPEPSAEGAGLEGRSQLEHSKPLVLRQAAALLVQREERQASPQRELEAQELGQPLELTAER